MTTGMPLAPPERETSPVSDLPPPPPPPPGSGGPQGDDNDKRGQSLHADA